MAELKSTLMRGLKGAMPRETVRRGCGCCGSSAVGGRGWG
jgi:hypothetical protein